MNFKGRRTINIALIQNNSKGSLGEKVLVAGVAVVGTYCYSNFPYIKATVNGAIDKLKENVADVVAIDTTVKKEEEFEELD